MPTPFYASENQPSHPWTDKNPAGILNQRSFIDGAVFFLFAYKIEHDFQYQHVEHLQKDPTSKVLIIHDHSPIVDAFTIVDKMVLPFIEKYKIDQSQIVLLLMHWAEVDAVALELSKRNIKIQLESRNQLLLEFTKLYPLYPREPIKKFSILSRTFKNWRLEFFFDLFNKGLMNDCIYSFSNVVPYTSPITIIDPETMFSMLVFWARYNNKSDQQLFELGIKEWINGMPYEISGNIFGMTSNKLFDLIRQSYIHVVLETSIEHQFPTYPMTEKTYKAIAAMKPFILYSDAFSLHKLKELDGYKTFHPFIDESYDAVLNNELRKTMIIAEMKRISELPQHEFLELIKNCKEITEYNFHRLVKLKTTDPWSPEFKKLGIL